MEIRQKQAGFFAFFISGICAISSGVVVSLLQEELGFAYGTTGTLLAMMNVEIWRQVLPLLSWRESWE